MLQIRAEIDEINEGKQRLRNDLVRMSAELKATITLQEEVAKIINSWRCEDKEQPAAADDDNFDGGAFLSPPGGEKAVDGEQDGEAVPRVPPAIDVEKGFHKSQSSNAMLNPSPPAAVGTPQGDRKRTPMPRPKRTYAMVVAGVKPAPSPLNKTSQQQPPSPSSSSRPAPTVSVKILQHVHVHR